ncbi:glycerophosphoryl diester phosphodiesterase membrane domain-containing protein [Streptococcus pseudoporcinus]|uniref:Membrane domain of glycerophosphoryl diester phosphodiesterase n=2 Tax=Streptococcus pseudoporcinus TaxID=361101 RepID=G5K9V4_9STRE|nr:glycerophosphoryl diester phosphodiesterase membrane domain-containing protein [Streptococcus pseudoporcinus]EHI65559.1 membrane domain of glycerophosphoryl diester phosphodiesterase [Streptococcus pseudoporcinus LQ 940-04]VEF93477.1 Glycerophosphoryl diester phosphodiesterase [Streptococcus pseudoporcinus]
MIFKKEAFSFYFRFFWSLIKFQIVTKGILFLAIFPIAKGILQLLLTSSGKSSLSSGDFLPTFLSLQGAGIFILVLVLLVILVAFDINAFIIISALARKGNPNLPLIEMLGISLKSVKNFLKPQGLLILIYVAIIIPLIGIGVTISPMSNFKIPNFITDVIYNNPVYLIAYGTLLLVLTLITLRYFFFFHYCLLEGESIKEALKKSASLMKGHWKAFIKDFLVKIGLKVIGISVLYCFLILGLILILEKLKIGPGLAMFVLLTIAEIISILGLLAVPIIIYSVTDLFYRYNERDGYPLKNKVYKIKGYPKENKQTKKGKAKKLGVFLILASVFMINASISVVYGLFFDEIAKGNHKIALVAHRGGGNLAAENTIAGMRKAIKAGATWTEIDIQRTKDGYYVINHDPTFKRLTGIDKASDEMTLEEIKSLKVKDFFDQERPAQPVATLEQFLKAGQGKIGFYLELKGDTADKKMADDIVKLIKAKKLEKSTALLSLDLNLINYIEKKYPEITTGYLYYFSLGEISDINADILIMEEGEATTLNILKAHEAGKKVVVWTINSSDSISKFVKSDVDAVITDFVLDVKKGMRERDARSDLQIVVDDILN